jgi:hypothetical protein
MKECSIDLPVGGGIPPGVRDRGRSRVLVPRHLPGDRAADPTVETWVFDGRPHLDAVETVELRESGGVTTGTIRLTYLEDLLKALLEP